MYEGKGIPKDEKPIIYLSGGFNRAAGDSVEEINEMVQRGGFKYRCYSHAFCCSGGVYYDARFAQEVVQVLKLGVRVMMDSGAYSFHQMVRKLHKDNHKYGSEEIRKLTERTIESYVQFCKQNGKQWDFYINYDHRKHAPTVYQVQKQLEKAGLRPVPVFHGDDTIDWFKRYVDDGHTLICVGGSGSKTTRSSVRLQREYFDIVFNLAEKYKVQIHGLAQTALNLMFRYPFASVDSTSWTMFGAYGYIIQVDKNEGKVHNVHVSDRASEHSYFDRMPKAARRRIAEEVEREGFDFEKVRNSSFERCMYNARMFTTHLMDIKEIVQGTRVRWESLV